MKQTKLLAALLVILMAILGLMSYVMELRFLSSVRKDFIPMAPATALCFLLQGVILLRLAYQYQRWRGLERITICVLSGLTAVFGLLEVLGHFMGLDLNFEDTLIPTLGYLGEIPLARMSPLTGALFFLTGTCMLTILLKSHSPENRPIHGAGILGGLVIILSFTTILSYLMGTPLLYEQGATVPMALTTALGFFCAGTAIVTAAGKSSLPLRIFTGHSTKARLLKVFLPLVVVALLIESLASFYIPKLFQINTVFISATTIVAVMMITGLMVNRVSSALGLVLDQAEKKRNNAEKNFRDLVDNSPIGISIIQNNKVVYQNPKQEKLFGPLPRQIELTDIESIHPDDLKKTEAFYKNVRSNKAEIQEIDFRFYPMDDPGNKLDMKWVHCQASRTKYMGNKAILKNILDITHIKELEKLVAIQDKMSALGRVSAGISHEIGNALASMNIDLFNLHKMCDTSASIELEKTREICENLQSVYGRIKSVIKRGTDFSNPSDLKFVLTDINQPINMVIDLVEVTLRDKGIILEKELTEDMEPCQADPKLIMQVILNIINNASEALINAEKNKRIGVFSAVDSDRIVVRISDSGPGVPPGLSERVFDPFYTTKTRGAGIGLSLCQRIITDHGGSIDVSSSKWGGAAFIIKIPINDTYSERSMQ